MSDKSISLCRLIILVLLILFTFIKSVKATDLEEQKKALNMIADFADRLCNNIPLQGSGKTAELTGQAKAELQGLLKKIANLGIEGAAKWQEEEWSGVIQKDLTNILVKNMDCKLKVFDVLKDKITTIPIKEPSEPKSKSTVTPPPTPTPIPYSGIVPFADTNNPNQLNSLLGWQPGGANVNSYDLALNPGFLTLIAGAKTDQWGNTDSAPLVFHSISGDFEAQVKLIFNPISNIQIAGMGVRSSESHNTWLRIGRHLDGNCQGHCISIIGDQSGASRRLKNTPYNGDTVFSLIFYYLRFFNY